MLLYRGRVISDTITHGTMSVTIFGAGGFVQSYIWDDACCNTRDGFY